MKLKLYHAAAAAAIALSVMLLTACGSPKQADPLPIIKLRTVGPLPKPRASALAKH